MERGMTQTFAAIALLAYTNAIQAKPPRTLVPVAGPLEQLHEEIKEVRDQSAEDLDKARKTLQIAAPKLSERLENLAQVVKRLEKETIAVAESVTKGKEAKIDKARELLGEQEKLNQRIEHVKESLRRDANAQDMKQKEGRERARDADDAVAMLENPPRDAKNALEESTANIDPEQQHASLDTAVHNQNELTEALNQLAEHYGNLENGEGEKTRAGLREKEEELGIKERLDEQFAALEQALELVNMSPSEQIKVLEEKLKDNPVMQEELRNIAEATLDDAKDELAQEMAQKGESGQQEQAGNDPKKGANEQDVKAAVEQARAMAEKEVPKIQKDAEQAKADGAKEDLKQAKESLQAAAQKGEQAMKDPSKSPEEKMQAMSNALNQAAKSLDQAAQKAGERAQAAKDPGQKAAAEKAQAAAKAAAQKAQQMAQKGESGQQQQAGNDPKKGGSEIGRGKTDPVEAYMWAYVAREHARKTPGQKSNAVKANIHLNRIKKELSATELKAAEAKAKAILSKL